MRIVFFGTPQFAASVLEHLIDNSPHEIVGIVSKPDKPRGRDLKLISTEVATLRNRRVPNIPLFQPKRVSQEDMASTLSDLKADLFVVVAYGEIMRPMILSIPKYGCVNVHASLLPQYRGAAPMQRALLDGVESSGVTIMKMDEGLDSGDMMLMRAFPVPLDMNMEQFSNSMLALSKEALLEALLLIENGTVCYTPQDHRQMTLAPKIMTPELQLFPILEKAIALHNKIRAFSPKPGAYCTVRFREEVKRLKIVKTSIIPKSNSFRSSSVLLVEDGKILRMQLPSDHESDLSIERVQLEGKKEMDAGEFLNGIHAFELNIE
ncbi:MAG: methionyl-tRNA formyltransferase [Chlamydia sp.]